MVKCPHCGKEISEADIVTLDRDSIRVIAQNMKKTVLFLENALGEKLDCRKQYGAQPRSLQRHNEDSKKKRRLRRRA